MTNTKMVFIGVVVILLLVAASLMLQSRDGTPSLSDTDAVAGKDASTNSAANAQATAPGKISTKAQISELHREVLAAGNTECLFNSLSTTDKSIMIRASLQMSGGKMRGEFRETGTNTSSKLLVYNGTSAYFWTEGKTAGQVRTVSTITDLRDLIPVDITGGSIFGTSNNNVSWDCHPWIPSQTKLSVPAYVSFN